MKIFNKEHSLLFADSFVLVRAKQSASSKSPIHLVRYHNEKSSAEQFKHACIQF